MKRFIATLLVFASLLTGQVLAQSAIVLEVEDGKGGTKFIGFATVKTADGKTLQFALTDVTVRKLMVTPPTPPNPTTKVTRVTYVFEKDNTAIPPQVAAALIKINADSGGSVVASSFEQDQVDGSDGLTPDQYVIALREARAKGLPALVVQSGANVLRVLLDRKETPLTTEKVIEASK